MARDMRAMPGRNGRRHEGERAGMSVGFPDRFAESWNSGRSHRTWPPRQTACDVARRIQVIQMHGEQRGWPDHELLGRNGGADVARPDNARITGALSLPVSPSAS